MFEAFAVSTGVVALGEIGDKTQLLALPNVKVCGGSWLTPAGAAAAGDWSRITQLARAATALRG